MPERRAPSFPSLLPVTFTPRADASGRHPQPGFPGATHRQHLSRVPARLCGDAQTATPPTHLPPHCGKVRALVSPHNPGVSPGHEASTFLHTATSHEPRALGHEPSTFLQHTVCCYPPTPRHLSAPGPPETFTERGCVAMHWPSVFLIPNTTAVRGERWQLTTPTALGI